MNTLQIYFSCLRIGGNDKQLHRITHQCLVLYTFSYFDFVSVFLACDVPPDNSS